MSQPLDWKTGKFLKWCTHLPYENQIQTSPAFSFKNTECCFELIRKSKYYYLYLKPKFVGSKLEPFSLEVHFKCSSTSYFTMCVANFTDPNAAFFSFDEYSFNDLKSGLRDGFSVAFLFALEHSVGLWLPSERKIDEKSTQADLMLSMQADAEYLPLDFGDLLKKGDHSDVQLICRGGNISAHKAILAARSKVFSDMFKDSAEESKKGLINLIATEKSIMELCVEFIYKGKILNLPIEKASDLYVLGHDLKIFSLKKICGDMMIFHLCEDNYIAYLVLADKYDDECFKCGITDYISDHVYLLKSESWMKFSDEHMKTANKILQKCVLKFI